MFIQNFFKIILFCKRFVCYAKIYVFQVFNFEQSCAEIAFHNLAPLYNNRAFLTGFKHFGDIKHIHLSIISCQRDV